MNECMPGNVISLAGNGKPVFGVWAPAVSSPFAALDNPVFATIIMKNY